MTELEKELAKVTGVKRKRNEEDQKYFTRLIDAAQNLKDKDWEGLSDGAQNWVNAGVKALNDDKDVEDFVDAEPEGEATEEEEAPKRGRGAKAAAKKATGRRGKKDEAEAEAEAEAEEEEAPKGRGAKKATTKAAAKKTARGKKDETEEEEAPKGRGAKESSSRRRGGGERTNRTDTVSWAIREVVFAEPWLTAEQVAEKVKKKGFKDISMQSVTTLRAGMRNTIRFLQAQGIKGLPNVYGGE